MPPSPRPAGTLVAALYRLDAPLGTGGMATVYDAVHLPSGTRCALKLLRTEIASLPGFAERFVREARAAATIAHPGVVHVYDAGVDREDGALYLAMERLEGRDLAEALRGPPGTSGALDADRLLRVALDVLRVLDAAHARGIVHRDVKPENVFLCTNGATKLLDFGVLKQLSGDDQDRLTRTGVVLGTPHFMSPEQLQGGVIDGRADVWSLGAMLYDALAGRPPYVARTFPELVTSMMTVAPEPLAHVRPELPGALAALVDKALARDPRQRWSSARALGLAIGALLGPKSPVGSLTHVAVARRA